MTAPVPDAAHQAALLARLEHVEEVLRATLQLEEDECRQFERLRIERGSLLVRLSRAVAALRWQIVPPEDRP